MRAAAVILAAGASRRLGSPKQVALVAGEPLLNRAVRTCKAAEFQPVLVVLGSNASEIELACDLTSVVIVKNEDWASGAASSVRAGINALESVSVDAAVLLTCDMPFLTPNHLQALSAAAEKYESNVGSEGEGWTGVPACFLRASFPALLALTGDTGARSLLKNVPTLKLVNDIDVDTLQDLEVANAFAQRGI